MTDNTKYQQPGYGGFPPPKPPGPTPTDKPQGQEKK
jgi:hypothetical protein